VDKTTVIYVTFLHDVACQKLLKLANVSRSYSKNNTGTVFLRHGVERHASAVIADVQMSVCLYVTRWYCVKTTQAIGAQNLLVATSKTLFYHVSRNSYGFTPSENLEREDRYRQNY